MVSLTRIVQCHGCFDLLHLGHKRHFEAAKQHGDYLVVTVTPDRFVRKGPGRPMFAELERLEMVLALECVDEAHLTDEPTAATAIRQIRPVVFAKGPDYSPATLDPGEKQALDDVGGELVITPTHKHSSTALLTRSQLSPEAETYLAGIRGKYSFADVRGYFEKASGLKVLVVGDAIQDEYHYVDTLGKSGKDPILAAQFVREERYIGGVQAVAEHARAATSLVRCVAGDKVTIKRRFVEQYPFQKLFEVYDSDWTGFLPVEKQLIEWDLRPDGADVVIVADYGHGAISPQTARWLGSHAGFLAVNVQANAGNHGFNTIGKYDRADFVSLSEREIRLDTRDQDASVEVLASRVAANRGATVLVTRGEKGCAAVSPTQHATSTAPALTSHAVDRTGAGDAVFAVCACLSSVGMPLDLLTFVASAVGSQAVGIMGNSRYIEREPLLAYLEALLS